VDRNRRETFLDELAQCGIAVPSRHVCLVSDYGLAQGRQATASLLAAPDPPTAIFMASDGLALGALRALYDARIRVPDEMSLVSYDDTIAAELYPPLSSISQPLAQVASSAVSLLLERIENPNEPPTPHLSLPTHFVTRSSTSPPGAGELTPTPAQSARLDRPAPPTWTAERP
jgi:LacI family transcriptional regulator